MFGVKYSNYKRLNYKKKLWLTKAHLGSRDVRIDTELLYDITLFYNKNNQALTFNVLKHTCTFS